jgi:hypothetical protein
MENNKRFIEPQDIKKDTNVEELSLTETMVIYSGGAFRGFTSLTNVYFGLDITRIGNGTFRDCKSLTDVWFAITDENKIIEIADDAFDGCDKPITFHIFATALKNKSLNEYAKKHGFRVTGMI